MYVVIYSMGGSIGAAFALGSLYAVGLSLLTGVTLSTAARAAGSGAHSFYLRLRTLLADRRAKSGARPFQLPTLPERTTPDPSEDPIPKDPLGEAFEVVYVLKRGR